MTTLLLWLVVAFLFVAIVSVAGFVVARWLFVRAAERVSRTLDNQIGGLAARAVTRLGAYARATGIDLAEADRRFGVHIDRFARVMDSAVTLPLIGPIGLDAVLNLVPGVGDVAGAVLSLVLVARSLRYGPPAGLVSKMLANVLTDAILGAIPVVGVLADVWFRANDRNARLLREYVTRPVT